MYFFNITCIFLKENAEKLIVVEQFSVSSVATATVYNAIKISKNALKI